MAIHVGDLQLGFVDGGFDGHGGSWFSAQSLGLSACLSNAARQSIPGGQSIDSNNKLQQP
jgi:hypothetical protein